MTEYEAAWHLIRMSDTVRVLTRVGQDPSPTMLEGCGDALRQYEAARKGHQHVRRNRGWQHRRLDRS